MLQKVKRSMSARHSYVWFLLLSRLLLVAPRPSSGGAGDGEVADAAMKRRPRRGSRRCCSGRPTSIAPQVDGTTALHWAVRVDDLETGGPADPRRRERVGGEPRGRDAAAARRDERQRADARQADQGRRRSERAADAGPATPR